MALRETYPDAYCELDFANPLQLLIATILSAQCTDKRVNLTTPALFQRCPTARDYAELPQEELERLVQSTGFFRSKAKNIRECCAALVREHGGEVPQAMESLTALAGVGRKTANVVLGNAFGIQSGVVVDTHVHRLSQRLGLTRKDDPINIELELMKLVPRELWTLFPHWMIFHGRRRCFARKPDCAGCELQGICPSAFKAGAKERPAKAKQKSAPRGRGGTTREG